MGPIVDECRDTWSGILGVDPAPFTLRRLAVMAKARQSSLWDHTATLWCLHAEINRDSKKRPEPYEIGDVHPFIEKTPERPMTIGEAARTYGK